MVGEGFLAKLAGASLGAFVVTDVIPRFLHAGGEGLIFFVAVSTSGVLFARGVRRAWRSGRDFIADAREAIAELSHLPQFRTDVIGRFDYGDERFDGIDIRLDHHAELIGAIADADTQRIRDLLARNERRSPVNRRTDT